MKLKDEVAVLGSLSGFMQKNPFTICKLFTKICNMVQKSNTKVHNFSAHPVKGRNSYYSGLADTLYPSKLIGSAFFVILHSNFFFKLLFSLGKCSF